MSFEASTPNLGLPQWVYTDKPQMIDFNGAFLDIDSHIVESGSSENGKWVKFCDGTMICYRHQDVITTFSAKGNLYISNWIDLGEFPQSFVVTPTIVVTPINPWGNNHYIWTTGIMNISKTSVGSVAIINIIEAGGLCGIEYIAVGRWKSGQLYDNTGAAILDGSASEITMSDNQDYTSAYSGAQMDDLAGQGG